MAEILLTIAIPTYNRANLLDKCLYYLTTQITAEIEDRIEVIVFDNDSPDNTTEVINKYINKGLIIQYYKNQENIGGDRNIASCFLKASGKYVWVFSDDDFILPGYLKLVVDLLGHNDFGNIYISSLSYNGEYVHKADTPSSINYSKYDDPLKFIDKINYWSTFLTGNVVNKSLFSNYEYVHDFYSSNLVQLSWVLPIIFAGKPNVVINDQVTACLANNSGGYKLYEVFGKNYNQILDKFISEKLIAKQAKSITNTHLLKSFFPMFLHSTMLQSENALKVLIPIYWSYPYFWFNMFPALIKKQLKNKWLKN